MNTFTGPVRDLAAKAADGLLWLIAMLNALTAASLLAALLYVSDARAEEVDCAGSNILTGLELSDPARLAALRAEAAAVPNGKGLLWKIEGHGQAPSFLLGTMHVTDPRVLAMPGGATEAFARAETVIVESDEIVDQNRATAAIMMQPELTMFTGDKTINDFLKPEDRALLENGLKARGIPCRSSPR